MIFVVEDDAGIREIEVYTLMQTGFEAQGFPDGEKLFSGLKKNTPELIILDIMLPGEDGVSILKRLRAENTTSKIPVIMATAKGLEYDKVKSLDLGADDYLVKPFGMMEMVSRVKAVLRRTSPPKKTETLRVLGIALSDEGRSVTVDGKPIALTYKEFEILKLFMSHIGVVFTRDRLFSEVWGMDFYGETRTVDMHIRTLRSKLGDYGRLIVTVRGVGYKLEVPGRERAANG
ncbi:MAG: response regulator transcription factor [Clostridia bacterium]|nr:response regulator transcription factor [Clostridia bacterium]